MAGCAKPLWAVDLINNYSVGGRTHHMETRLSEGVERAESDVGAMESRYRQS